MEQLLQEAEEAAKQQQHGEEDASEAGGPEASVPEAGNKGNMYFHADRGILFSLCPQKPGLLREIGW